MKHIELFQKEYCVKDKCESNFCKEEIGELEHCYITWADQVRKCNIDLS